MNLLPADTALLFQLADGQLGGLQLGEGLPYTPMTFLGDTHYLFLAGVKTNNTEGGIKLLTKEISQLVDYKNLSDLKLAYTDASPAHIHHLEAAYALLTQAIRPDIEEVLIQQGVIRFTAPVVSFYVNSSLLGREPLK